MAIMPPKRGELRANLRFERRSGTRAPGGVINPVWEELLFRVRAKVSPTMGGEAIIAGRIAGKAQYDIWVPFCRDTSALNNGDRAVNTRTEEIYNLGQPIDPMGDRTWLLIQATSVGNAEGQG